MSDRIEKTIELKASVERVWRALTDPVEFGAWFRVKLDGPFAPGRETAGQLLYPGFEHLVWRCRTVEMDPPRLFAFTWHPYAVDPDVDYSKETPTRVEFRLEPTTGGTRLFLTESGFEAVPAHRREEAFLRNEGGWTIQMENIRAYLDGHVAR